MVLRPRFSDTFAFVGILLLVVSVPGYVAQDGAMRSLSDGYEFRTGEVRLETTLELEAIVHFAGAEPVVVGPVRTMTFRAAEPHESPPLAAFVHEDRVHPIDLVFPWGHIQQASHVHRTYFDADGLPVWYDDQHARVEQDGTTTLLRTSARFAEGGDTDLSKQAGQRVVYHPSTAQLAFLEVVEETRYGLSDLLVDADTPLGMSSDLVAEHHGIQLFRTGHSALQRLITGEDDLCAGCNSGHPLALPIKFQGSAIPADHHQYADHDWFTPAWPTAVGMHMDYYDPVDGETFLETTVAPRRLVAGDGDRVTIRWFDTYTHRSGWLLDRGEPVAPLSTLKDILADDRPLYRDIGFDALRAAVRSEPAPQELRRWAQDAQPVEFFWIAEPPQTDLDETVDPTLLPLPQGAREPVTQYPSRWFLTLARPDGALRAAEVRFVEEKGETSVTAVREVCDEHPKDDDPAPYMGCGPVDPARVAGSRTLVDPWHLIAAAEEDVLRRGADLRLEGGDLQRFAFQSLLHMDTEMERYWTRAETNTRMWVFGSFNPHWVTATGEDDLLEGVAYYRHASWDGVDRLTGSFDMRDGAVLDRSVRDGDSAKTPGDDAASVRAAGGALLVPLDVVPESALAGGVFLVTLSLLVRFASWVKAGGALPVFAALYAKIAKGAVLDNARREQIMDLVRADPGVTASEVARRLGFGWGATVHHLETLVRNGYLAAVASVGRRHYFTMEEGTRRSRLVAAARRDGSAAALLDAVSARPGSSLKELAELLDRKVSGLSRTGSRLAKEGLLRKERDGMSVRFWPAQMASATPGDADPVAVAAES